MWSLFYFDNVKHFWFKSYSMAKSTKKSAQHRCAINLIFFKIPVRCLWLLSRKKKAMVRNIYFHWGTDHVFKLWVGIYIVAVSKCFFFNISTKNQLSLYNLSFLIIRPLIKHRLIPCFMYTNNNIWTWICETLLRQYTHLQRFAFNVLDILSYLIITWHVIHRLFFF